MAVTTIEQLPNDPGPLGFPCSIKDHDLRAMVALYDTVRPEVVVEFGICKGSTAQYILSRCPYIKKYIGIDVGPEYQTELPVQRKERPENPGYMVTDPRFSVVLRPNGTRDLTPASLRLLIGGSPDAIFIDADHSYRNVLKDTELAQRTIKPCGLILWHDYHNVQETTEAIDFLNEYIMRDTIIHIENSITCYQDQADAPRYRYDFDYSYGLGPDCYNPSVCSGKIAYRKDPSKVGHETAIVLADVRRGEVQNPQVLRSKAEDPRLFTYQGRLMCSFSDNPIQHRKGVTIKMLDLSSGQLATFGYGSPPEKNWCFFEKEGRLHFVYDAHTVVEVSGYREHKLEWSPDPKYGEVHGGTPPVLIEPYRWLTLYHSAIKPKQGRQHYFVGAYIFDQNFRVCWQSAQPIWWTGEHITEGAWDKYVVFPGSCEYDPGTECITVAYGLSDKDCRLRCISMKDLLSCGYSL